MGTRGITNNQYTMDGGRGLANKTLGSFKKGGKVKKTGIYKLHQGEMVVPKKSKGMKMLKKAMGC